MRKLAITLAVTAALVGRGFLRGRPEAATSTEQAGIGAATKDCSLVKKAACRGYGRHCLRGFILGHSRRLASGVEISITCSLRLPANH